MMELPKNRLWALLPTNENLTNIVSFPYRFANSDHCLVISPDAPKDAIELDEADYKLLGTDDMAWIIETSEQIKADQIAALERQRDAELEAFLKRFELALQDKLEGIDGRRKDT